MAKETGPILVTRVLDKEGLNTEKKLLPVRPKTVLGIRKRKKTMSIAKRFALHANAIIDGFKCLCGASNCKTLVGNFKTLENSKIMAFTTPTNFTQWCDYNENLPYPILGQPSISIPPENVKWFSVVFRGYRNGTLD